MKLAWWYIPIPLLAYCNGALLIGVRWDILIGAVALTIVLLFAFMYSMDAELEMEKRISSLEKRAMVPDAIPKIVAQLNTLTTQYDDLKKKYETATVAGIFGRPT